jgi:hypothetical protein
MSLNQLGAHNDSNDSNVLFSKLLQPRVTYPNPQVTMLRNDEVGMTGALALLIEKLRSQNR